MAMIADLHPDKTNQQVFMEDFLAHWPVPELQTQAFFDAFYRSEFALLRPYCDPFPGMAAMMKELFTKHVQVVIATQPVFPQSAIQDRLAWAGLGGYPYALVTSYEHMHACKPHTAYYQEIADRIGVAPQDCLMVGNDIGEDLPAGKLGMQTFLLEERLIDKGSPYTPDYRGRLAELFQFMKHLDTPQLL
jgi:FMN phosphatase YigB (HAD superfamily)